MELQMDANNMGSFRMSQVFRCIQVLLAENVEKKILRGFLKFLNILCVLCELYVDLH